MAFETIIIIFIIALGLYIFLIRPIIQYKNRNNIILKKSPDELLSTILHSQVHQNIALLFSWIGSNIILICFGEYLDAFSYFFVLFIALSLNFYYFVYPFTKITYAVNKPKED